MDINYSDPLPRTVYGLYDPDGSLRYVGITGIPLEVRLRRHMYEANKYGMPAKRAWLCDLWERGLRPSIRALEHNCAPRFDAYDREQQWIIWSLYDGADLVNRVSGAVALIRAEVAGTATPFQLETIQGWRDLLRSSGIHMEPRQPVPA